MTDNKVYYMGPEGMMEFDGEQHKNLTKKSGAFFNTHVEGFMISKLPLRARLFGKRMEGVDGGYKCAGYHYKGIMYVTEMGLVKKRKRYEVDTVCFSPFDLRCTVINTTKHRWRWMARLDYHMINLYTIFNGTVLTGFVFPDFREIEE